MPQGTANQERNRYKDQSFQSFLYTSIADFLQKMQGMPLPDLVCLVRIPLSISGKRTWKEAQMIEMSESAWI